MPTSAVERIARQTARSTGRHSPSNISLYSFILGLMAGGMIVISCVMAVFSNVVWPLPSYIGVICLFHWLEYFMTATYNEPICSMNSFLLDHSPEYKLAHISAIVEFTIRILLTQYFNVPVVLSTVTSDLQLYNIIGISMIVVGQYARSAAMATAQSNFSHVILEKRPPKQQLVTHGIYSYMRHPSYFGFFFWALGTQILLGNPVNFCLFWLALFRFFKERIGYEEVILVEFFGDEYQEYRKRVRWTGVPFI